MPAQTEPKITPSRLDKRVLLGAHPFFEGLVPELIDRVGSHAITRVVKAGTVIYTKGDPGNSLFIVITGTVRVSLPSVGGKDTTLALLPAGEVFGEIALLDGRPRSADVAAVTDCELMVINRRDFVPFMHDHPEVAFKFIDILCERLRSTNEQVERVVFLDLPTRLAKVLIQLAQTGETSAEGWKISVTQRAIGQMIGMSRESTNKQLRNWEERNWVRLDRGSIVLMALDKLAALATAADGAKG
jgi:CRP/FNR family transcriptional regulator, cyclic AMP receptor protein